MKNLNIFSLITEYDNAKSGVVLSVPNVSFVDEDSSIRYLLKNVLTHNGYEYVDLGLPSGLKWATCNVGANSPEEYGLYFAWGETTGYTSDDVKSGVRSFNPDTYNEGTAASISANLTLEQDAAHVNIGGKWRMPTEAEFKELCNKCNCVRTDDYNGTGVAGCIFTSKVNGNSVFFPAAGYGYRSFMEDLGSYGYYWSASWFKSGYASELCLYSIGGNQIVNTMSYSGLSVRAVCE